MDQEFYYLPKQNIELENIETNGFILDIGGGGEGIIGQLCGNKVIAIDPLEEELEETKNDSLKIVMDGCDLKFISSSFSLVTSFFTFMYIEKDKRIQVLKEVNRVLGDEGEMMIWDLTLSENVITDKEIVVIPLNVILPDRTIETGYGCRWKNKQQTVEDYEGLFIEAGFVIIEKKVNKDLFYFHIKKKPIIG